jgi:signal transduction histidine kinase
LRISPNGSSFLTDAVIVQRHVELKSRLNRVVAVVKGAWVARRTDPRLRSRGKRTTRVVAKVPARMMPQLAEQATEQLAYRTRLEARLVEAQKLETLGLLAGGVAHDFNNLINTIMGYTDLGRLEVESGGNPAHCFEGIDRATRKARELTLQLMAYAGKGESRVEELDLGVVAKEIAHLLGVSLPGNVTLRCDLADRIPFVKGDPTQIFQVAMNLFTNAFEACPASSPGRITLRTCTRQVDPAALGSGGWVLPLTPGCYATLEVTDNGVGMTSEILARVLEPFFTTKPTGHGLGLAAVTGILRSHRGGLRVVSEPSRGSSFTIFLPAMAGARSLPDLESKPVRRAEGTLLIVEAEPEAGSLARHLAEQLGFTVIDACDGPEAVETFRRRHGEVALVIMALSMPGMGGEETFRAMQAIDSHVPVVLNSGFSVADADLPIEGLAGRLKTPFRAAEFQGLLQRALGPEFTHAQGPA